MANNSTCTVNGCDNRHHGKGYCQNHYGKNLPVGFTNRTHGLSSTYKKGCRCEPCKEANKEYEAGRREQRNAYYKQRPAYKPAVIKKHGATGYSYGCRCDTCRAGKATKMREFNAMKKAEYGVTYTALQRRKFKEEHGYRQPRQDTDIKLTVRLEVYERDNWTCQICGKPVLKQYVKGSQANASVDHIVPQSQQLVPDHTATNLRTAHYICNAIRGNRDVADEHVAQLAAQYLQD